MTFTTAEEALVSYARSPILVVDPNRFMRTLVCELLRAAKLTNLCTASTASEALEQIGAWRPHAMFVADRLHPLDGVRLTHWLRTAEESPSARLAVVLMTTTHDATSIKAARDAGVNEVLLKPVTPRAVYSRLYAALSGSREFVQSAVYTGPCRRRQRARDYTGPLRRLDDDEDGGLDPAVYGQLMEALEGLSQALRACNIPSRRHLKTLRLRAHALHAAASTCQDIDVRTAATSLVALTDNATDARTFDTEQAHMHLAALTRLVDMGGDAAARGTVVSDLAAGLSERRAAVSS